MDKMSKVKRTLGVLLFMAAFTGLILFVFTLTVKAVA